MTCVASASPSLDPFTDPSGRRSPLSPNGPRLNHTTPPAADFTCTSPPNATVLDFSLSGDSRSEIFRDVGRFRTQAMTSSCCTAITWISALWRYCFSSRKSEPVTCWHARTAPGLIAPLLPVMVFMKASWRVWRRAASARALTSIRGASSRASIHARSMPSSKSNPSGAASLPMRAISEAQVLRPSSNGASASSSFASSSATNDPPSAAATCHDDRSTSPSNCFGAQPA
mmetsp:Transcript_699/g.2051  ORF Transcript_699/g.2051 Transcript_699/m.2051 type:complete len:229 (-) Transcript_699:492-1178(-)